MDAKNVGLTIAALRKKKGCTQAELAEKLNVSNKTVSKWESGQGYPDISQFPALSAFFGVSIDYIMTGERKGIAIAGNILLDLVKNIDCYPEIGMLAGISKVTKSVGGCVPNTGIDLIKIDKSLPVYALARVGNDENGQYLVSQLQKYGIHTGGISISPTIPTSFSDVMSMPSGERTFFHARGANAEFSPECVDISMLNCRMLHIGYILLLDSFDAADIQYGTVMARFLNDVQQRGIKTSIDVVSDSTGDFPGKVRPALKYCNYVILNEIEACQIWGFDPRNADGTLNSENIFTSMRLMAKDGVKDKVIVHSKEAGFCLDVISGKISSIGSLIIPSNEIKGSVGAGDAFCAGCLYGIYNEMNDEEMLEFASAAAACSLREANSIDGMLPHEEIEKIKTKYRRIKI